MKASAGPHPPPPAASHPIVCIYVNDATAAPAERQPSGADALRRAARREEGGVIAT